MNFRSALNRPQIIHTLESTEFDLVIIGGGITGAGIALDASSRGMKVALIEKDDFASGTSSKSTKLVHGGLRYLKQLEIALVREVGLERAIVHKMAPHLVVSEKMVLPLVEGGTYGKLSTSFGLALYDFLAGVEGEDKRIMLSAEETLDKVPLLRNDILRAGGFYAEYRTDDARLTIENIKTAIQQGAICINYVRADDFVYEHGKMKAVVAKDVRSGQVFHIKGKFIVSAAGPWVDTLRKKDKSLEGKRLFLSKGVHIVVPHERFPLEHSVYFDVPDGRMMFAIPRHRTTYIGTTDTPYQGDINHVVGNKEDVDYLLKATNSMFPAINLTMEDVESSWAGLRPLIHEEGKSASEMSRKDEIFVSETGFISIAGGKLTGYRKMAERISNLVTKKYKRQYDKWFEDTDTSKIELTGGPFKKAKSVRKYTQQITEKIEPLGLSSYYAPYLVSNYGRQTEDILALVSQFSEDTIEVAIARAELRFGLENELITTPLDFFARRTGRLYFNLPSIKVVQSAVLKDFTDFFNWDSEILQRETEALDQAVYEASHFS